MNLFFEDCEPVPPIGIEAVREQTAGSIAEGAVLMMIPYIRDRKRVVRVNLSLEKGFLDTLDEAARIRGMTRSAFVQKAATREILDPSRKRAQSSAGESLRRDAVEDRRYEAADDYATSLAVKYEAAVQAVAEALGVAAGMARRTDFRSASANADRFGARLLKAARNRSSMRR